MHTPRIVRQAVLVVCGTSMTACYSYVPAEVAAIQPGAAVRLRVTAAEAERLEPLRHVLDRAVEGQVTGTGGGELLIDTSVNSLDPMRGSRPLTQRLNIALAEINEVELRRRDNLKTGLAVGAFAIAAGIVVAAALGAGIGGTRDPTEPVTEFRPLTVPGRF